MSEIQHHPTDDGDHWHPHDKAWMARRKEEWRAVKASLDVLSASWEPFKRKYHKYHKELFFHGTLNGECFEELFRADSLQGSLVTGDKAFLGDLPLFKIWYHPAPEALDLGALREEFLSYGNRHLTYVDFMRYYWGNGAKACGRMYDPNYGMMGGREALWIRLCAPSLDYCVKDRDGFTLGVTPENAEYYGGHHTAIEICKDARFVAYAPGQYLWDHLSYAAEHYPHLLFMQTVSLAKGPVLKERIGARDTFLAVLAEGLSFPDRTDASIRRPTTIALVERLLKGYERKEFSDGLLALWDEAKERMQELKEAHPWLVYESPERIDRKYGGFPVEKQQERIARWKLV